MFKFSNEEIRDLIIALLVLSLAFSILFSGRDLDLALYLLPLSIIGVGSSFIFHELAHKFVAMHYGYWAEFKLWMSGLVIALLSSFIGVIFAAPGAVYIHGQYIDDKENGVISIAGPAINIVLALIFFALIPSTATSPYWRMATLLGFYINSYIGLFNLIPLGPLDGAKVLRWNGIVWLIATLICGGLTYLSWTVMHL